jgi:biotin operon repressor
VKSSRRRNIGYQVEQIEEYLRAQSIEKLFKQK